MAVKPIDDGGAMRAYVIASWVILRLYAAAFAGCAWVVFEWSRLDHPALPDLLFGLDASAVMTGLGMLAVLLGLPFLTPRFIATPQNVFLGLLKAVVLIGLAYLLLIYSAVIFDTWHSHLGTVLKQAAPLVIKSIVVLAVTGAIFVGLLNSLQATPTHKTRKKKPRSAWEARLEGLDLQGNVLRDMRKSRMDQ